MEERFEVQSPTTKSNCFAYIWDIKTDNILNLYDSCDLLNQQDKRIKELEETNKVLSNELTKNSILKQDHIETCCGIPIFEIPKMKEENQQLKQQLHDLPKKIVEEIKQQVFNHFKVKNIEEYEKLPLIDCLFTADTVIEILEAILQKYGGEDDLR